MHRAKALLTRTRKTQRSATDSLPLFERAARFALSIESRKTQRSVTDSLPLFERAVRFALSIESRKTQRSVTDSLPLFERAARFALLIAALVTLSGCARAATDNGTFSGEAAMAHTRKAVEFGPRPSGSEAHRALQAYILDQLKSCQCEVIQDTFTARDVPMNNIVAHFKGTSGKAIAISGHYDTKPFPGRRFVGANDGGSSTGMLLEFARILTGKPRKDDVYVIFFDGEEAFGEWSDTDKLYGSRHLAYRWYQDGTLAKLKALINVDMIGDRSLNLEREPNSDRKLTDLIWRTAADLGYGQHFLPSELAIDDDHMPFVLLGVPAADLIDFDYPHWHEDSDTLDKLSAESLQVVGRVVEETVKRLEAQ